MHTRRDILKLSLLAGAGLAMPALMTRSFAQAADLSFDAESYQTLTTTVTTEAGDRTVTYRFYKAVPYVANPVDVAYQSLNISVPIAIDGVSIDAGGAPILFANSVGGYMPSSVADADGIGGGGMMGPPAGAMGDVGAPNAGEVATGGNSMLNGLGEMVSNSRLALAAGYVVVEPGARGRTLVNSDGVYYGTAPAAIVDLKAAVRYLRFNRNRIPGDVEHIVSSGTSAGGALSALLGASGDSSRYASYLAEIGAADESDAIFAVGSWCPITDLEHADMAYEWNWGANPLQSGDLVDRTVSDELRNAFADYQLSLGLRSPIGAQPRLTVDTYGDHMLDLYLRPAATEYLSGLSDADRSAYLAANPQIGWQDGAAQFDWAGFLEHVGARKKNAPAFDAFDLSSGENSLFGTGTTGARHFTDYALQRATGDASAELDADIAEKRDMMNPMLFLHEENPGRSNNWWLRVGAKDSDTSLTVVSNLAASLEKRHNAVNARYYWDAGHGANEDADAFVQWIGSVTGYES